MAKAGRPKKEDAAKATAELEKLDVLGKIKVYHDYHQHIVIMDVSEFIPYSAFGALDTMFPRIGLIIKQQFGYLGFGWGYGDMKTTRSSEGAYGIMVAPVSLHIYFQHDFDDEYIKKREKQFANIYQYLVREWEMYKGISA